MVLINPNDYNYLIETNNSLSTSSASTSNQQDTNSSSIMNKGIVSTGNEGLEVQSSSVLDENTDNELIKELEAQIQALQSEYDAKKSSEGVVGKIGGFFSSLGNAITGDGWKDSDTEKLEKKKEVLAQAIKDPSTLSSAYKLIMGTDLTQDKIAQIKKSQELNNNLSTNDKKAIVSALQAQASTLSGTLDKSVKDQGWLGKTISWCNNGLGIGTSEKKSRAQIAEYQKLISSLDPDSPDFAQQYKSITGEDLSIESLDTLFQGVSKVANSKAAESIMDYEQTQATGKEIVAGIGTALVVVAAVAAAPFTGGASLGAIALTAGFAAGVGGVTMVAIKGSDGITSANGYSLEQGARDFASGAIEGALIPVSGGVGSSVAKSLGKTALSTTAKTVIAGSATGATYGGIYNGGNYFAQTVGTNNFSFGQLTKATITGAVSGAASGAVGGATSSVVRPFLTSGETAGTQILGRLASGGATGLAAGAAGGAVGNGTNYLLNSEGKEISFEGWLNASLEGAQMGAAVGSIAGIAFESVNLAAGAPKPEGTASVKNETLENGLKIKNYYDKNGNIIASDINAADMQKMLSQKAGSSLATTNQETALSADTTKVQNLAVRTVRMNYSPTQSQTFMQNGSQYTVEAKTGNLSFYEWNGNFNATNVSKLFVELTQNPQNEYVDLNKLSSSSQALVPASNTPKTMNMNLALTEANLFKLHNQGFDVAALNPNTIGNNLSTANINPTMASSSVAGVLGNAGNAALSINANASIAGSNEITNTANISASSNNAANVSFGSASIPANREQSMQKYFKKAVDEEDVPRMVEYYCKASKNELFNTPEKLAQNFPWEELSDIMPPASDYSSIKDILSGWQPQENISYEGLKNLYKNGILDKYTDTQSSLYLIQNWSDALNNFDYKALSDAGLLASFKKDGYMPILFDLINNFNCTAEQLIDSSKLLKTLGFESTDSTGIMAVMSLDESQIAKLQYVRSQNESIDFMDSFGLLSANDETWANLQSRNLLKSQFSVSEMKELAELNNDQWVKAKNLLQNKSDMSASSVAKFSMLEGEEWNKFNQIIDKRDDFSDYDIQNLINLKEENWEKANKLIFIEGRENQLSSYEITSALGLEDEQFTMFSDLLKEGIESYEARKISELTDQVKQKEYVKLAKYGFKDSFLMESFLSSNLNQSDQNTILDFMSKGLDYVSAENCLYYDSQTIANINQALSGFKNTPKGTLTLTETTLQNNAGTEYHISRTINTTNKVEIKLTATIKNDGTIKYARQESKKGEATSSWNKGADRSYSTVKNTSSMESQIQIINDAKTNEPAQVLYTKKSALLPGAYESTVYDLKNYDENIDVISAIKNGNLEGGTPISSVIQNADGSITYQESFNSDGNKTQRSYTQYKDAQSQTQKTDYSYKITDENGNKILEMNRSFVRNANTTTTVVNGKKYIAYFNDTNRTITLNDGTSVRTIDMDSKIQNSNSWETCKNLPADLIVDMDKYVNKWSSCNDMKSCFNFDYGILMSGDNVGIIAHELGHAEDHNNSTNSMFTISSDPKLIDIYNEEIYKFNDLTTKDNQDYVRYFSQTGGSAGPGLSEVLAETRTLLTTYGHDREEVSTRAQILTRYFPNTISYIAKLLNLNDAK